MSLRESRRMELEVWPLTQAFHQLAERAQTRQLQHAESKGQGSSKQTYPEKPGKKYIRLQEGREYQKIQRNLKVSQVVNKLW